MDDREEELKEGEYITERFYCPECNHAKIILSSMTKVKDGSILNVVCGFCFQILSYEIVNNIVNINFDKENK